MPATVKVEAVGFDGDVTEFGTPARRAAVLRRPTAAGPVVDEPDGRWTAFDHPVSFGGTSAGCLVLGLDDIALLQSVDQMPTPGLRDFMKRTRRSKSLPSRGLVVRPNVVVWVTSEQDARFLLAILHSLVSEQMISAICQGRGDDVNRLAWRLWRTSVTFEEKALAIAGLERSIYPEHASLVLGQPDVLSDEERGLVESVLAHARSGLDWAVGAETERRAS